MNPYAIIFSAVVAAAMLAGSYLQGRKDGANAIRADYAARDLKASQDYAAKEREITDAYRKKEAKLAQQVASVSTHYQRKVADNAKALDIAIASGRLYDRFATNSAASRDCTAKTPADPVATRPSGAELSQQFTEFLKREASRADKVVLDLNLCIGILEEERK